MQTALLGAAIAIILALVTALVGPLFVDWGRFRDAFETKAQQLTGLDVKIAGPIEVHLLPTPTVKLQAIEAKRAGQVVRARSLQIEFALDALMRGEFRAANLVVTGPEVALGLDRNGRFEWSAPGSDAETLSMNRISIEDGRLTLSDARGGGTLNLEKLTFRGELRSLAGPVKGDGAFDVAGEPYAYHLSTNRPAADGAVRVHLAVDTVDQPRLADIDGSLWTERGVPHLDANLQWSHGFGRASAGEPFRLTGHVRGTSGAVAVDKVELQYGPEDRAARLRGDATLTLGEKPELAAMLAATQIDLDRLGMLPEAVRRKPLAVLHSLGERWSSLQQFPIPVRFSIGVDAVTLAGASLQRLSADFRGGAGAWTLDNLTFRAPGVTQMRVGGRLTVTPTGTDFTGPVHIEARDPRALVSWLTDRSDALATTGSFRADGEVRIGPETFAIDRLKAELDRVSLEGRFAYRWPGAARPARIEAALSAPEVDFDKAFGLAQDMFAGTLGGVPFEWPREGTLALNVARSSVAGVAVQGTDIDLRFDDRTLDIERLAVADLGGASIAAKGNIDLRAQSPRGNVTLDLDVRTGDGVIAVLDKLAPDAARELRRSAGRYLPAKLTASLATDASPAAGSAPGTRFKIGGSAGQFAFSLEGGATTDALAFTDLAKLGAARLDLTGSMSAAEGGALVGLVGLDRLVVADKGAGRLDFKARGALDDPMTVDGRITAGALDVSANGTLRLPFGRAATASVALAVANADLRTQGGTVPASLTSRLELTDTAVTLTGISGQFAGAEINGRLTAGLARPTRLDGDLSLSRADLPALIAAVAGMPAGNGGAANAADPFGPGLFAGAAGKIGCRGGRCAHAAALGARPARDARHRAGEGGSGRCRGHARRRNGIRSSRAGKRRRRARRRRPDRAARRRHGGAAARRRDAVGTAQPRGDDRRQRAQPGRADGIAARQRYLHGAECFHRASQPCGVRDGGRLDRCRRADRARRIEAAPRRGARCRPIRHSPPVGDCDGRWRRGAPRRHDAGRGLRPRRCGRRRSRCPFDRRDPHPDRPGGPRAAGSRPPGDRDRAAGPGGRAGAEPRHHGARRLAVAARHRRQRPAPPGRTNRPGG